MNKKELQSLLEEIDDIRHRAGLPTPNEDTGEPRGDEISCRSEEGITVGIIDSIITDLRLIKDRDLTPHSVQEALLDIAEDPDLDFFLNVLRDVRD